MNHSERRFVLRGRTREGHEKLDAAVGAFDTIDAYRRYVACLGAFRAAIDADLRDVVWPDEWQWRPTLVADMLAKDADDLDLQPASRFRSDIDANGRSALLGLLYVLQGSTLGARLLQKRAAVLGLDERHGARHLALMSRDLQQWQSFLAVLETERDFEIERAVSSANAVFVFALRCFESESQVVQRA